MTTLDRRFTTRTTTENHRLEPTRKETHMSTEPTPGTNRRPNYLVAAAPMLWAVLILFHPDARRR